MAKVVAIHEIVRPGEVIKPGTSFNSTGEELAQLKAAGAVKFDTSDAEDAEVKTSTKTEDGAGDADAAKTAAKTAATVAGKGKTAKADKDLV